MHREGVPNPHGGTDRGLGTRHGHSSIARANPCDAYPELALPTALAGHRGCSASARRGTTAASSLAIKKPFQANRRSVWTGTCHTDASDSLTAKAQIGYTLSTKAPPRVAGGGPYAVRKGLVAMLSQRGCELSSESHQRREC